MRLSTTWQACKNVPDLICCDMLEAFRFEPVSDERAPALFGESWRRYLLDCSRQL
jgi:hypothetical protein